MRLLRWWARELFLFVLGTAAATVWATTATLYVLVPSVSVTIACFVVLAVSVAATKVDKRLPEHGCDSCKKLEAELDRANAALALTASPPLR